MIFAVAVWYIAFPLYNVFQYFKRLPFWSTIDLLLYSISIFMYFWILGNTILGLKIPLLQRILPQDKKTTFHILTGVGLLLALLIHTSSKIISGYILTTITWILLIALLLLFLLSIYWISAPGMALLHRALVRLLRKAPEHFYDILKQVHGIGFPISLLLVYLHIREADLPWLTDDLGRFLYIGCFWFTEGIYVSHLLRNLFLPKVELKKTCLSGDLLILKFEGSNMIKYRAGQFAYLTACSGPHRSEKHPFSFLSSRTLSPEEQFLGNYSSIVPSTLAHSRVFSRKDLKIHGQRQVIEFAIRQTGDFTHWIQLAEGKHFTIDAAYGNFRPLRQRFNCLIGTGSGMVPIIALLNSNEDLGVKFVAFLRGREQDGPLLDMVSDKEHCHILDKGSHISANLLIETLKNPSKFHYYICASPSIKENIITILRSLGVRRHYIHWENFSLGKT